VTLQEPSILPLADARDVQRAGGKAAHLAELIAAGFPVPDGFVVTTTAFRRAATVAGKELPSDLARAISGAYQALGSPTVAVRSSATAEDMADTSMAGQYETFLDVRGEEAVLGAVRQCWQSVDSQRVRSYLATRTGTTSGMRKGTVPFSLRENRDSPQVTSRVPSRQHVDPTEAAMAVVVQKLVPADVAGVLFTANPRTGNRGEMLVDASWGLGEAVVSGSVQPDTYVLDLDTGAIREFSVAEKTIQIEAGWHRQRPVPEERRNTACLQPEQIARLWDLGRRVAEHFGCPQDVEWAIEGEEIYLLQSRPITALEEAEAYRRCLAEIRSKLRRWKRDGRGDWVRHNLGETLPHPTPLSWSLIGRFMSGDGGFGAMYRRVGFEPSPTLCRDGFLDLIGGRIYMDLSCGPEMFFADFPYAYDLQLLRSNPDAAQAPPTVATGSALDRMRTGRKLAASQQRLEALAADFDRRFEEELAPEFAGWVEQQKACDLRGLSTEQWLGRWQDLQSRVLDAFAPHSLLPSLIAAMATDRLRTFLAEHFWQEHPDELGDLLSVGGEPDKTLQANQDLYEVAVGGITLETWLADHGHRGPEEFDLAASRWRERPHDVIAMAMRLAGGDSPMSKRRQRVEAAEGRAEELAATLGDRARREFRQRLSLVHRYLRFREDGKYYLMLGYDLLRDMAREAGRRLAIGNGVFLLTADELCDALQSGMAPRELIDRRRHKRAAEKRLALPAVITEDEIATLGNPPPPAGGDCFDALPVSIGTCRGPVRIVSSPDRAGDLGRDYVLICPSTDPSWTPLFVGAAGLILERGGTLSHGAVVAREMGIPAVILPEATKLLAGGETVSVDGRHGVVIRGDATPAQVAADADPADVRIDWHSAPPPRGPRERRCAALRNAALLIWGIYLVAAFLLPEAWLYRPSIRVLDAVLWPLVRSLGRVETVAVLAAGLAGFTMIAQWLLTDNRRLRAAKHRANRLRREATKLPEGSPRRAAMLQLAAPVQARIMGAAMLPLAIILGPMIMSFLWLPERVDPASANASTGAVVYLTATVDGEHLEAVTCDAASPLRLDPVTPAAQSIPPIRPALERLRKRWREPSDLSDQPWEVRAAATAARESMLADLDAYLARGIPPQILSWTIRTPPDSPGRFSVRLSSGEAEPMHVDLVLGNAHPPEPKQDLGDGKGPIQVVRAADPQTSIRQVQVVYRNEKTREDQVFWRPLRALRWPVLQRTGWTRWDAGWLLTYIAVYVPVMLLLRFVLRIA